MADFKDTINEPNAKPKFVDTVNTQAFRDTVNTDTKFKDTINVEAKKKFSFSLPTFAEPTKATEGDFIFDAGAGLEQAKRIGQQAAASLVEGFTETNLSVIDLVESVTDEDSFIAKFIPQAALGRDISKLFFKTKEEKKQKFAETITAAKKAKAIVVGGIADEPKNIPEAVVRTGTKFVTAFFGLRKATIAPEIIKKSSKLLPRIIRNFQAGAMADFTVFDPHEARVSNLIEKFPALSNPVTQYLMASKEDSRLEGRMKQVLEGAGFNFAVEGFIKSIRFTRSLFHFKKELDKSGVQVLSDNPILQSTDIEAAKKGVIPATKGAGKKIIVDTNIAAAHAEVPRQIAKDAGDTVPLFTKKMTVEAVEKITEATKAAVRKDTKSMDKIMFQIADALRLGEIQFDSVPRIMRSYGMSEIEIAESFVRTASFSGKILNRLSQMAKQAKGELGPEAVAILERGARNGPQNTGLDLIVDGIRRVENFRRGLLVTQLTTAVRNTLTQAPRMALGAFDDALQTVILGVKSPRSMVDLVRADINAMHSAISPFVRGSTKIKNVAGKTVLTLKTAKDTAKELSKARAIFPEGTKGGEPSIVGAFSSGKKQVKKIWTGKPMFLTKMDEIFEADQFALQTARLLNQPVHEVVVNNKGLAWYLNVFNRTQEIFFRKIAFEAKLRQAVTRRGLNFDKMRPAEIPIEDMKQAVDHALEMTFARSPKGHRAQQIIQAWNDVGLTTVNPFPRFAFANALPFVWEHSPAGFITAALKSKFAHNLAKKTANETLRSIASGSDQEFAKAASRATIGTLMLMSAWHIRQSVHAGDKWYEIKWEGADGEETVLDLRTFAPLSTHLFIASAIMDKINGTNKIKTSDYAQQLIGLNRISGSGLMVVDLFRSKDEKTSEKLMTHFAGQYIGSFGVPAKTVKDIVAQFSTEEAILRNTREDPLFAPFLNNLPFASQKLPPATSPFKDGINLQGNLKPIRIDNNTLIMMGVEGGPEIKQPLGRQIFGLTLRVRNPVENEVSRLDMKIGRFFPKTGNQKANRLIAGYMGYLSELYAIPFIQGPEYQAMDDANKKKFIEELYFGRKKSRIKRAATRMFAVNHFELATKLKLDKLDDPILQEEIDLVKQQLLGPSGGF